MLELNKIYLGDCLEVMQSIDDKSIDMILTSPPYDELRQYNGYCFKFEETATELFRIIKNGGVIVWVVGDSVKNGSETGTSFKQALYFKQIGFNLHDTMIYQKNSYPFPPTNRYYQQFEYMFVLSKNKPKTTNLLRCESGNKKRKSTQRNKDGSTTEFYSNGHETRIMDNIWKIDTGYMRTTKDKIAYEHPAIFPDELAEKHILTWSNPNDIILDPLCGSGTTLKLAAKNNRQFIGIEISDTYINISNERLKQLYLNPN